MHVCRGTPCYALPAGVYHQKFMGAADDVHGLCGLGFDMLLGKRPLQMELMERHKRYESTPEFKVELQHSRSSPL